MVVVKKIITRKKFSISNIKEGFVKVGKKVGAGAKRLTKNKKFIISVSFITVAVIFFFAGMGVQSLITKIPPEAFVAGARTTQPSTTSSIVKVIFRGNVTEINSTSLKIKDSKGVETNMGITEKSTLLSNKSKPITTNDIKVGSVVLVYANRDTASNYTVDRLRVVE